MNEATPVRQKDTPPLAIDFSLHLKRGGAADTTLATCTVECFLADDKAPGGASDPAYPDAAASTRANGTAAVSSPWASFTFGGGTGDGPVEGADYIVQFNGVTADGKKCTGQIRQPVRKYV